MSEALNDITIAPFRARAPRVSVIMPAYDTAAYLGAALDSVRAQTFTDYEVIVVNDGSPNTPELEAALAPYRDGVRYLVKTNGGVSSARNFGIRAARGVYVAMLDSDDMWEPDYLATQVATLDADADIAVSYANALIFGNSALAGRDCMSFYPSTGEVTFERLVHQECIVLGSVTARRAMLLSAGLYDESLATAEDFDLWLRLAQRGQRIVYHRRPLWRYRRRAGSLSTDQLAIWGNYLRVLEKAEGTMPLTDAQQQAVTERCAYINAMLDLYRGKQALFAGELDAARISLTRANHVLHQRKLSVALWLLRRAPRWLVQVYEWRDRYVFGASTKV